MQWKAPRTSSSCDILSRCLLVFFKCLNSRSFYAEVSISHSFWDGAICISFAMKWNSTQVNQQLRSEGFKTLSLPDSTIMCIENSSLARFEQMELQFQSLDYFIVGNTSIIYSFSVFSISRTSIWMSVTSSAALIAFKWLIPRKNGTSPANTWSKFNIIYQFKCT